MVKKTAKPQQTQPTTKDLVQQWADARTNSNSNRHHDLLRDKYNVLLGDGKEGTAAGFFNFTKKPLEAITPDDIKIWQHYLEDMKLSPSSIYTRVSRVSSFYDWIMKEPLFEKIIEYNPAKSARPKPPVAYQSEKAKALSDEATNTLLQYVAEQAADKDNLSAKRDYALLRFYFATGKRRSEIIELRWKNLLIEDNKLILYTGKNSGQSHSSEISDTRVSTALITYLKASGRWNPETRKALMEPESPIWLRHDRAAKGQQPVTSHGFVYMLKKYAKAAGIGNIHLHQTRHTVARMIEESGDLTQVQTVLGHQSPATTRAYLDRVGINNDKHTSNIAGHSGFDTDEKDESG